MEFIKKNYEKIILSLVLLGLVAVLVAMWFVIQADKQRMMDLKTTYFGKKAQPLPDLDLTRLQGVLDRLKTPYDLDFSTTNKLFNPVQWQMARDGRLIKITNGHEIGPGAAVVTKITPLYFSITLDSVMTNSLGARYIVVVEHQAAPFPQQRHPQRHYISNGEKIPNVFKLSEVKGDPANPSELDFQLADSGELVTVSPSQPFRRVEGYAADLKYDPEKINATGLRIGDQLNFAGDQYNIIAIDQNSVVLLAQSNQKKYVLRYTP